MCYKNKQGTLAAMAPNSIQDPSRSQIDRFLQNRILLFDPMVRLNILEVYQKQLEN